jgi:(p)ppGpp synthase/HD superfamily hydrolase
MARASFNHGHHMPHPSLTDTIQLATQLHAGQTDKAGAPYVGHLARVCAHLERLFPDASDTERHAAWLHDTIEDTGMTGEGLSALGYASEVVETVQALTKPESPDGAEVVYADWIATLARTGPRTAIRVKLADLHDNADPQRLAALPNETASALRDRYEAAMATLWRALG